MRGAFRYLCGLSVLGVCACGPGPQADELATRYHRNPAPKRPYRIELKIADAPGPFAKAEGFVGLEAPNCTYIPDRIAGATSRPSIDLPMAFSKVDESTFVAMVYADAMLDEDYQLGDGVCHWELRSVNAWVMATGAKTDIHYVVNLVGDEIGAHKPLTNYYVKDEYPGDDPEGDSDHGNQDRNWFRSEFQNQLFAISITAEAATL